MLQALQDHMEEETSQRSNGSVGKVEYSVRVELGSDAATRRREPLISWGLVGNGGNRKRGRELERAAEEEGGVEAGEWRGYWHLCINFLWVLPLRRVRWSNWVLKETAGELRTARCRGGPRERNRGSGGIATESHELEDGVHKLVSGPLGVSVGRGAVRLVCAAWEASEID